MSLLCPVWIIYEQVMIAALDCSRDDLALVSFQVDFSFKTLIFLPGYVFQVVLWTVRGYSVLHSLDL